MFRKGTRIAVIPEYTLNNASDSFYIWGLDYAKLFVALGMEVFFFVPHNMVGAAKTKGIHEIGVTNEGGAFYGISKQTLEIVKMLNPRRGSLFVDIIFTGQVIFCDVMQKYMYDCNFEDRPLIILNDLVVYSRESKVAIPAFSATRLRWRSDLSFAGMRAYSYLYADIVLIDGDLNHRYLLNAARDYMSGGALRDLIKRLETVHLGVDFSEVEKAVKEHSNSKFDVFTLMFGGRLNSLKRPKLMLSNFVKLFSTGDKYKILLTSPKGDVVFWGGVPEATKEIVDFRPNTPRSEFVKLLNKSHIVLYPAIFEGVSVGVLEMVLSRTVVILPNLEWAKYLVGEDYPFLFNSEDEIIGMIAYAKKNYKECIEKAEPSRLKIKERFKLDRGYDSIYRVIAEGLNLQYGHWESCDRPVIDLVRETIEKLPKEFTFDSFLERFVEKSASLSIPIIKGEVRSLDPRRLPSILGFMKIIDALGWSRVPGKEVRFRKEDKK